MADLEDDVGEVGVGVLQIAPPSIEDNASLDYLEFANQELDAQREAKFDEFLGRPQEENPAQHNDEGPIRRMSPELRAALGDPDIQRDDVFRDDLTTAEKETLRRNEFIKKFKAVTSDIGRGVVDTPEQIYGGAIDAFDEAGQLLGEITGFGGIQFKDPETGEWDWEILNSDEWKEQSERSLIAALKPDDPDTVTSSFVRSTAQFLTGFLPALKAVKGLGISGKIAQPLVAGALTDAVVFDPHEDRLSTFLNEVPALEPFVSDYLADNDPENESSWQGRMKNAIEGAGIGLAAEGVAALFKGLKYYKAQRKAQKNSAAKSGRETIRSATREEVVDDISDASLAPLGRADGPLLTRLAPDTDDKTAIEAYLRTVEAEERAAASLERNDALSRITAITEEAQASTEGSTPADDALNDLLDAVRSGETPSVGDEVLAVEEFAEELKRLDIDPSEMSNEAIKKRLDDISQQEAQRAREFAPENAKPTNLDDVLDNELPDSARPEAAGAAQPTGRVFINHARINSSDDVKAVLQEMAELDADAIEKKTRGVVSNKQTISESSQEYRDLDELIGRPPGPMTAAQATAARRLLVSSGEQIVELAKRASAPDSSPADIYNFRRGMAVHYAIQSEVMAARTETARALQSWAIPAAASKARNDAVNSLIHSSGGTGNLKAIAKAVAAAGDNPEALNSMTRELGRGKWGRAYYQLWINGLLYSPKTHIVNFLGNSAVVAIHNAENYLTAGISKTFYDGQISLGEANAALYGTVKGLRDGVRVLRHGNNAEGMEGISDVFETFAKLPEAHVNEITGDLFGLPHEGFGGTIGHGVTFLGRLSTLSGQALHKSDIFFKAITYRSELQKHAFRDAQKNGLTGQDMIDHIADILRNPPPHIKADAIDMSHYNTFTNELGHTGKAGTEFLNGIPAGRYVVPFVKTVTNLVKYSLSRTPLAFASSSIRADIKKGGADAAQAYARIGLGTTVMLVAGDMALEGTITGGGPVDPRHRAAKMQTGWRPYSIKVGDRWYQYSRTDPISSWIGIAADIAEISTNANEEEREMLAVAAVVALSKNLESKSYLSGIYDFIGAIDPSNPTNDPGKYLQNFAVSLVPFSSLVRTTASTNDPILRDNRSVVRGEDGKVDPVFTFFENTINGIKRNVPFSGGSDLPPRRDLYGEEIDRSSGLGKAYDALSPIASKPVNNDPVTKVILDNNIRISRVPRMIKGVELTSEQYSEFSRIAGQALKEQLDGLVTSSGFKQLSGGPDGMKANIIQNIVEVTRKAAADQILAEYPELLRLSQMRQIERAKLLQGEQN